jgi:uncharacterized protein (DUF488 family)
MAVFTVGHSNRSLADLVAVLRRNGVAAVADVRAWPRSRRWPQFDRDALEPGLRDAGFVYRWLGKELGGHREAPPGPSPHVALAEEWRGYAAHAETEEFAAGIDALLSCDAVAFLCAEKDWRHCHRRFIADHLVALKGIEVVHLGGEDTEPHALDPRARIAGDRLVYDRGAQPPLFEYRS